MKRSVQLFVLLLLVISIWSFGPITGKVEALTTVNLTFPADSVKVTVATPTFEWSVRKVDKETPKRFHLKLADNLAFNNPIWEDTTIGGSDSSKIYNGPSLTDWTAYYWAIRVEVDSQTVSGIKTYWQEDFTLPHIFFYTTATLFHIHADGTGDLPDIQTGIIWAAANDTVLVEPGIYYENLRFYKNKLILTSNYLLDLDHDTSTINGTIIDGSKLTRGKDYGSVVTFTAGVDSNSYLTGFTLRGGLGTKIPAGAETKMCGGGIYCEAGSSPSITYNVITNNSVENDGGGIFINSAAPNIFHNIIINNSAVNGYGGGIESAYSIQVQATPPASQNGQKENDVKNSLNPRDATEIAPALTFNLVTNAASADSPVAVVTWEARKDTIIHRDKYFPGDTIILNGTGSYDPNGDSFVEYRWEYYRDTACWLTPSNSPNPIPGFDTYSPVCTLAIDNRWVGKLRIRLRVGVTVAPKRDYSDIIPISVQYPPHVVGNAINSGPGDTLWLDGSASCDVNPSDILTYRWTQDSGTVMPVVIENATSAKAYFIPQDSSWVGRYKFRLTVSDSMDSGSVSVVALCSQPPVAVCKDDPVYGDTLVGFTTDSTMTLDGSSSYVNNPGDVIKYYYWEPVLWYFPTSDGVGSLTFTPLPQPKDSTKVTHNFTYAQGGLIKFRLRVKDSFGVMSQNYDSVFYSIQTRPFAQAGKDTIVYTETRADLKGSALEINPDQRNSVKYTWLWGKDEHGNEKRPSSSVDFQPSNLLQSVYFDASASGVYGADLQVMDDFGDISNPDEVIVVANKLPHANAVNVSHAVEGNSVLLDASASYDPDSVIFVGEIKYNFGGGIKFHWTVASDGVPANATTPVIVDADKPIASFVPYGTGLFKFMVLVNDTISVHQPPDSSASGNITFLTVNVDSTYAYPVIQGNLIAHNYAGGVGGGLDLNKSAVSIINNIFYNNQSKSSGGAICCRNSANPRILSNIFFGNISSDSTGGAVSDLTGALAPSATRGVRRNLTVKYNDFWANQGGILKLAGSDTTQNIYSFPRLIDPDFGNFTLDCTSPCIGAGDPLHTDIGSLVYYQPCKNANSLTMIALSLFQNPAATAVAHLLINTDAPLKTAPVAYITMGNHAPDPVYFTPISSNSFRGNYVFTSSGTAHISIFATSVLEKDTTTSRDFSAELIASSQGGTLQSSDKKICVYFPEGSVKEEIYATCIAVTLDPIYRFEGKPEVEALGQAYQLGPSVTFEKELTVNLPLDQSDLKDKDKTCFSIYRYEDGKWNQLESFLDGNTVCSKVKSLGVYRLIYDPNAKHSASLPKTYELFQNNPNPFNPETQIKYDLPATGLVQLTVYNILGQKVKVVVNEVQEAGHRSAAWDGKDDAGKEVASGIYFYKLQTGSFEKTKKMVLLK